MEGSLIPIGIVLFMFGSLRVVWGKLGECSKKKYADENFQRKDVAAVQHTSLKESVDRIDKNVEKLLNK